MQNIPSYGLVLLLLIFACQSGKEEISFNDDVRPIFNARCLKCHGGVRAKADFSLLFEEEVYKPLEEGKMAIVRGNHRRSALYQRLMHKNPEFRMPLDEDPLGDEEIRKIAKWIDQGAKWEKHWAYQLPDSTHSPPTLNDAWIRNEIDPFILARLKEIGLNQAEETDPVSLLRRVCLDLVGLPPTPQQAVNFLEDQSLDAYENLVDSLLASPHFGEKWATMWLDLARYADTKGYEKDSNRNIWKYRDWVIHALNSDMPFDTFSITQLAGDLLSNPDDDQMIATAFHRNSIANDEGGTDDEEFRVASVIERVGTTYEVWMATTFSCVQCHSHPYDPFTQEDFYRSMALFNQSSDRDIYNEDPRFHTYDFQHKKTAKSLIETINNILPESLRSDSSTSLFRQRTQLMKSLDYSMMEAEDFQESSDLIELIWPNLDMLWQVQDSSWVKYENIDMNRVTSLSFRCASPLKHAGRISVHLDSLEGPELGSVNVFKTGEWKRWGSNRPTEENLWRDYEIPVKDVEGKHDLYVRFWVGDTYIQHLFYLDKIRFNMRDPTYLTYNLESKLKALDEVPTTSTPVLRELPRHQTRTTRYLNRGNWLDPGREVSAGLPTIFEVDSITDRLEFAKWLVSDRNPLTGRVVVNRIWEQIFGRGLVPTMEEFGTQGDKPTHPILLDYLAVKLQRDYDWSLKRLIKMVVMSATYRQASSSDPDHIALDPSNAFLSRSPRLRLTGEQIRDQVLAVSRLLDPQIGGPSVIPPELNIPDAFIPRWTVTGREALYRRSLYTFWRRTDPHPSMLTFDSPDRMVCTSQRVRTNTPLQALNLLNDTLYFKAATFIAKEITKSNTYADASIAEAYKRIFLSPATDKQLYYFKELYLVAQQNKRNLAIPVSQKDKKELLDQDALAVVINAMMNLDEFIVKP